MAKRRVVAGYTRNHAYMFRGCENVQALYSPENSAGTEVLMHMFVGKLVESGFTVTCDNATGRYDCICRPFGSGFGVTILGILSGSGASWHGYPEASFGRTVEIDFNLCYLPKRTNHADALARVPNIFGAWLRAKKIEEYHSKKRLLYAM